MADRPRKRPVGLVVLAYIQFLFAAVSIGALASTWHLGGAYGVLSPLLTGLAMVATGVGYLRRSWALGFVGGNLLGFGSLVNILAYNAAHGFVNISLHLPSMVYPIVLLGFLNLRYKSEFIVVGPA